MTANGTFTAAGRDLLVSSLFNDGVTLPNMWIGLLLGVPEPDDNGDSVYEVPTETIDQATMVSVATGYERVFTSRVAPDNSSLWLQTGNGNQVYLASLAFPPAKIDWGFVVSWGLFTGERSGLLIATGAAGFSVNGPGLAETDDEEPEPDQVVIPERGIVLSVGGYV